MRFKLNWDALGIGASLACAIHCALLPLVMSTLPIFGINIIDNKAFEYFMIFLAFAVGSYALRHGYQKHHHSLTPVLLFTVGILFLFAKEIWHEYSVILLIPAVTLIVWGHFYNYRLCRKGEKKAANPAMEQPLGQVADPCH